MDAGLDGCQCRICFDDCKPTEVISPCKCKGTLRYVHPGCLRKWQANVQKLGYANDERAVACGVCRSRYTLPPPRPNFWRNVSAAARGVAGALCISVIAFGLSGPPFVHIVLLGLLLLGARSQALACLALLAAGAGLGALYARGLRLVLRTDTAGRLGVALIRYGTLVEGLRPGSLLVASPDLDDSFFERSVVLVTESGRRGARGVMLTQPIQMMDDPLRSTHLRQRAAAPDAATWHFDGAQQPGGGPLAPLVQHFVGGPVGGGGGSGIAPGILLSLQRGAAAVAAADGAGGAGGPYNGLSAAGTPLAPRRRSGAVSGAGGGAGRWVQEVVVLHHCPGVPGAAQLIAAESEPPAGSAGAGADCYEGAPAAADGEAGAAAAGAGKVQQPRSRRRAAAAAEGTSGEGTGGEEPAAAAPKGGGGEGKGDSPRDGWFGALRRRAAAAVAAVAWRGALQGVAGTDAGAGAQGAAMAAARRRLQHSDPAPRPLRGEQQRLEAAPAAASWGVADAGAGGLFIGGPIDELLRRLQQQQQEQLEWEVEQELLLLQHQHQQQHQAQQRPHHAQPRWRQEQRGGAAGRPHQAAFDAEAPPHRARHHHHAAAAAAAAVAAAKEHFAPAAPAPAPPPRRPAAAVRVFHGVCAWAAGQLEGELRAGLWGIIPQAALADVVTTPPGQLWRVLSDDADRVKWL